MRSPGVGAQITGMPGTVGGATTFNSTVTFNKTQQTGVAETIFTAGISDAPNTTVALKNLSAGNAVFVPFWDYTLEGSDRSVLTRYYIQTDTGTTPAAYTQTQTQAGSFVVNRPLYEWRNHTATVLSFLPLNSGANLAASWGTQAVAAPAVTTRSNGTRLVLYSNMSGTTTDAAIGVGPNSLWNSIYDNTSTYSFKWFGADSEVATLRGDGLFYLTQVGSGFGIAEGSNATMGSATLVGGTVTVNTTKVAANSRIFLTSNSDGGTPGWVRVSARVAGTSFTITSSSGTDTSSVAWLIIEPR